MGLFKKPNRKFRQRVTHTDSEDEGNHEESIGSKEKKSKDLKASGSDILNDKQGMVSTTSANFGPMRDEKADVQPVIPATKLLSFHDEEDDGEVFKLKKSNYSRRLARQLEKERKKRSENPAIATASTSKNNASQKEEGKDDDSKQSKESWNVLSGKEAEDMDVDEDDEDDDKDAKKENPFKDVLQSGVIPDAATIYAMKKHRQMAREMGDYIPLENPEKEDEHKSRLIREDDNDRSDDDDEEEPSRLSFTVNTGAVERQKVREAFLSLQEDPSEELENEDAADLDRWEQEQIRKGVSVLAQVGPPQAQQVSESQFYSYMPSVTETGSYYTSATSNIEVNNTISKECLSSFKDFHKSDLTTSAVKARLEERLSSLRTLHSSHEQELELCRKEIDEATHLIQRLEMEAPQLARRFSLYQQMRGYVKDLVECLDLKVAHIEVLDTKMMELYKSRAKRLISRRQMDVRDQADEYSLLSSKILKGSSCDIAGEKNGCLDEYKLRRTAEREGRRMRRRKQREHSQLISKHQDGMSSDDEEPDIEIIKFREKKENILNECKEVFEDVVEDFGTIQGIMSNFEKWKHEQEDSYCEAFVPLCLPKIFGPFVRHEMLDWNPLEDEIDFEDTFWFRILTFYSYGTTGDSLQESKDDPDINLLPFVVEKVLVPKITAFIKDVWDPMSTKQTVNLVNLAKKMHEDYPTIVGKSKKIQAMLQAVSTRIIKSLDDDVYIPLYPKELLENRSSGSSIFFQRQFWSTVKLLKNILCWDGILAEAPLQEMALSLLLNRYLLMGLHTSIIMKDTLEKCKSIVGSFPKSWFSGLKGSTTLPQLKQFSQYLVKYAQSFQSISSKKLSMDEEEIRDIVKEVIQLLITLNSLDDAVILAKQFSISGFKKEK